MCLFEELKVEKELNEISYSTVLTACGKGQQWQRALQIFHSMAPGLQKVFKLRS